MEPLDSAPPRSTASTWNWPAVRATAKSLSGGSICKALDKQQTPDRLLPRTAHDQPLLPELLVGNWGPTAVLWNKLTRRKCYLLSGLHVPTAITQMSGVGVGRLDPSNTPKGGPTKGGTFNATQSRSDERLPFQRRPMASGRIPVAVLRWLLKHVPCPLMQPPICWLEHDMLVTFMIVRQAGKAPSSQ